MKTEHAASGAASSEAVDTRGSDTRLMRSLMVGIFIFMAIYALYFARDFFMPLVLAFLLALMLTPIVRFMRKRGVPEALSATALVFLSVAALAAAGYFLSGPIVQLVNDAPEIGRLVTERLAELRHPFESSWRPRSRSKVAQTTQDGRRPWWWRSRASCHRPPATCCRPAPRRRFRAVAVPARVWHDVLREDRPVLHPSEREEAGSACRL